MKELPSFLQRWRSPPLPSKSRYRGREPGGEVPPPPAAPLAPSPPAAAHSRRVAALAAAMGELLRMPAPEVERLQAAALLHESGAAAVPAPDPGVALLVARQHADYATLRADGSVGRGERLLAGILRVADFCDAAARPPADRDPLPEWRRTQILQAGAGTRFHPLAVHAILRLEGRMAP